MNDEVGALKCWQRSSIRRFHLLPFPGSFFTGICTFTSAYHGGRDDSKPIGVGLPEASQGDVRFQSNQQRNRSVVEVVVSMYFRSGQLSKEEDDYGDDEIGDSLGLNGEEDILLLPCSPADKILINPAAAEATVLLLHQSPQPYKARRFILENSQMASAKFQAAAGY
ncbi:BnaA06g16690D [Brassica napus]|uniref:BnaA06g16690D protein n=1 Tax=Brassica napus TaxID=3708 RepID=A0A078IFR8_BRANA|nr:BnaA06g16690D [Brassica napus]